MRVQTISSLRNPGHLMRAGMNMLTTQVNSLRDYCGVITSHPGPHASYLYQQQHQQHYHDARYSPAPMLHTRLHPITTIAEDDEATITSISGDAATSRTPYAGFMATEVLGNASGIGLLEAADNSVLLALNNFNLHPSSSVIDLEHSIATRGQMSGGIGLFHGQNQDDDDDDDLVNEPERLIIYGEPRPKC